MCAGVAVGAFPDLVEASAVFSKVVRTCNPNSKNQEIYNEKYVRYKQAIECLSPLWKHWQ